jgi:uncharacterized protein (TIGR00369 family)
MRAAARKRYLEAGLGPWPPLGDPRPPSGPGGPKGERVGMTAWEATNPDYEQAVKDVILTMPAAQHLGFGFGRVAPGEAEIIQPYRKELTQHDGFFQGGVLGSLADFAGGAAAGTLLPPGWANMTIDYTVKIVAPAKGEQVVARGRVVRVGQLITVAAADVYAVSETAELLCAVALVTMRNIRPAKA